MEKSSDNKAERALKSEADAEVVRRILGGEEAAFNELVERFYGPMLRLAKGFLTTGAAAEEVVQEAWIGVLKGLPKFEGRSALKTWIFRILVNRCITRRKKDGRTLPFSSLAREGEDADAAVDPSRFSGRGMWGDPPDRWEKENPEHLALQREALSVVSDELQKLPERQRIVVTLRDLEGLSSEEVCNVLDISTSNQRVLLHRGRGRIRTALEAYYRGTNER